jgi:hypothetical protein
MLKTCEAKFCPAMVSQVGGNGLLEHAELPGNNSPSVLQA